MNAKGRSQDRRGLARARLRLRAGGLVQVTPNQVAQVLTAGLLATHLVERFDQVVRQANGDGRCAFWREGLVKMPLKILA